MAAEAFDLDALLAQFDGLGHRDRKAVLAHLTSNERQLVEAAMLAREDDRRREADRARRAGRQFAGYSPWLSELLQQVTSGTEKKNSLLTAEARLAIADVHRTLHADDETAPRSLWHQLRAFLSSGTDAPR